MTKQEQDYCRKAYEISLKLLNDIKNGPFEYKVDKATLMADAAYLVGYLQAPLEINEEII